jgi:hypothetical protein
VRNHSIWGSLLPLVFFFGAAAAQADYYYYISPSSAQNHWKEVNGGNTLYVTLESSTGTQMTYQQVTIFGATTPEGNGNYWDMIQSNPLSQILYIGVACTQPATQYSCGTNCVSYNYLVSNNPSISEPCSLIFVDSQQ